MVARFIDSSIASSGALGEMDEGDDCGELGELALL
jgi:hypothetical protein